MRNFAHSCNESRLIMVKAIIVDDEENARNLLKQMLTEFCQEVAIVGEAYDVPSAVRVINELHPDLIFLDVEMPNFNGFELFEFFSEIKFQVVFTTAYADYAIRAFEVSSTDYLLKPISAAKLKKAVDKCIRVHGQYTNQTQNTLLKSVFQGDFSKIALPVSDGMLFAEVDDIAYCRADEKYAHVFLKEGKKIFTSRSLKEYETLLPSPPFFRVNRSYLINVNCMKQFVRKDGGFIIMLDGEEIPLSKDRRDSFLEIIGG